MTDERSEIKISELREKSPELSIALGVPFLKDQLARHAIFLGPQSDSTRNNIQGP